MESVLEKSFFRLVRQQVCYAKESLVIELLKNQCTYISIGE